MAKNLHFTPEQEQQADLLLDEMERRGVELRDQRKVLSISRLVRLLMDEKARELGVATLKDLGGDESD